MEKIRVFVVDDSAFMRKLISDFVSSNERMEVVGTARNGLEAIRKLKNVNPDIITLDVEMPVMNGIEALKEILKLGNYEVIMLSSLTQNGAEQTIVAMENGAFDFISKPSGSISLDLHKVQDVLIEKIIAAYHAKKRKKQLRAFEVKSSPLEKYKEEVIDPIESKNIFKQSDKKRTYDLVAIGTSTGGPKALQTVLLTLPKSFPVPIVIVQHMPVGFTKSLANRLNQLCQVSVKEAEEGDVLSAGVAYIAPGGKHLEIIEQGRQKVISLSDAPPRAGHRPSVDVMFESIANLSGCHVLTVVMTGMGSDGTKGLIKLKERHSYYAIAESEKSAVVFGMPKAAIAANVIDEVCELENIGDKILQQIGR